MPKKKQTVMDNSAPKKMRKAITPEAREMQLCALAMDLVEQRLRDGTATSQEVVQCLKLGSTKEVLGKDILHEQKDLLRAKTDGLKQSMIAEQEYEKVIRAMKSYTLGDDDDDYSEAVL